MGTGLEARNVADSERRLQAKGPDFILYVSWWLARVGGCGEMSVCDPVHMGWRGQVDPDWPAEGASITHLIDAMGLLAWLVDSPSAATGRVLVGVISQVDDGWM